MRVVAVLMLSLLAFSGCLGSSEEADPVDNDPLAHASQKLFDLLPVEETWVEASDGKALHTAVYRPDTDEPVPVFINFSPYWGDSAEIGGDGFSKYMIDEYVPRGYAVVLASVRGTGHSEGCFQIGGDRELMDLHDTIGHFADQAWSNGNIAAGGKSYDSTSQNGLIAKYPHPALKGIFHVSGITDMYRYNYVGGVPYPTGAAFNTYYYLQGTDEYGASFLSRPSPEGLASEDPESLSRILDDVACTEFPQMQASGVGSGVHGLKDDYWIERDWNRYIADSEWDGSIFFVHGLQDWNVKPDHIQPWIDELPSQIRIRGWLHQETENNGHVYPMRDDWNHTMLSWLDSELKGVDNGFWDEPAWDVQGTDGLWRHSDAWPTGGMAQVDSRTATWGLEAPDGAYEAHAVWKLTENGSVRITGAPRITFSATSAHPDPVLTAILYDLAPDGTRTWVGEAVLRGIYREGLETPTPVVPGQSTAYTLTAYPLDVVLEEGHHLLAQFGKAPTYSLTTPEDTQGTLYDFAPGIAVLDVHVASVAARDAQPVGTSCFAC